MQRLLSLAFLAAVLVAPGTSLAQPGRQLPPGVLTVIPSDARTKETFTGPLPIVEITKGMANLDWTPNYAPRTDTLLELSKRVVLRRDIWNLEFAFKPLRMIEVDVPQPNGRLERKLVWYLVYRVKYDGFDLRPNPTDDRFGHTTFPTTQPVNVPSRRFFPHFVLESVEYNKAYLDRIIPAAIEPIRRREKIAGRLYNTVEITKVAVELSDERTDRSVWGVATWEDIDPRIDFFSIYIQGLTNAYQFQDPPGAYQPNDPPGSGRTYKFKTLKLNFWRPGDSVLEHEDEIRYGIPVDQNPQRQAEILGKYGQSERLDHLWLYR